jgi:hypothetical protein
MVCSDGLNEADNIIRRSEVLPEDERPTAKDLMRASQLTIAPLIEKEADIYTVADLKVRFR